ncbi:peroxisomal enoyl-CoA-hydratase [Lentinula guzmanii]|uniref:Peroxisomal enoyl-CoA-hydratase n=2 Tax=Lentinula TaxID=5352 RepID=A0AA38J9U3_9AGAR|nr:peroxisomal enoyl-CoA-hydratase [Lentinula guzmanii]KAJ3782820.1 peroxisomal enoyl-CoA-hydratase [Lentinula aff. detonsa]KAJ3792972.1 peroxisomal enoyl-CoA-hydratase [Lentinula aff. detonsa]
MNYVSTTAVTPAVSPFDALNLTDVTAKLEDSILIVTLNRSRKMNSFSEKMAADLVRIFQFGDQDDRVRAIVLTADPTAPAFCAGADMEEVARGSSLLGRKEDTETEHRDPGGQVAMAIYNNRKITVAAVNGHASGVGLTALQFPFDFRIIWSGSKLTIPFVRLGIVPESTSTYLLSRLIGESRATAVLFSGAVMQPDSPVISNLYFQILPDRTDVLPAAVILAKNISVNSSQTSIAYSKGLLHHAGSSIEENHLLDSRAMKLLGSSRDAAEGAKAFMQRRKPNFPDALSRSLSPWYPWWKVTDVRHPKSRL